MSPLVQRLPFVSNHWLLSGFVSLALLAAGTGLWLRGSRGGVQPTALYEAVAPGARTAVIVFYFSTS